MSIFIFPYLAQNMEFNSPSIKRALDIHKILLNELKETNKFIPEYNYIQKEISLEDICNNPNIYGNNVVREKLNSYEGFNIEQKDRLKYLNKFILNLKDISGTNLNDEKFINIKTIKQLIHLSKKYFRKIKRTKYKKNLLKYIEVVDEDISLNHEWIEKIHNNKESFSNLVKIFKEITDLELLIDVNCFQENYEDDDNDNATDINPLDYFVFTKNGDLKYFVGFNTIHINNQYLNKETSKLYITRNNIKALFNLIYIIKNKCYSKKLDSSLFINKPLDVIDNNKANITTFEKILEIIENDITEVKKEKAPKIGVFLDTANIFTGIRNLEIDFDYLFMCIYGITNLKHIKMKKATILYQVEIVDDKEILKENYYNLRNKDIAKNLEKYGFYIKEVTITNHYANSKDDEVLKEIIRKNLNSIDKVLLMTGDGDFKEIIDLCEEEGKEIKVISVCEKDSKKEIRRYANHSYIYEYWDCIKLYRG